MAGIDNIVITLVLLFILKTIDNMLTTGKAILVQRNRPIIAAFSVILSQIIFYKLIDEISASDNDIALYIVSIASGVGTYIALKLATVFPRSAPTLTSFSRTIKPP